MVGEGLVLLDPRLASDVLAEWVEPVQQVASHQRDHPVSDPHHWLASHVPEMEE